MDQAKQHFREESGGLKALLIAWYTVAYTVAGVSVKIFTKGLGGIPKLPGMENLYYSTVGGALPNLIIPLVLGWPRKIGKISTKQWLTIAVAGVCAAVVIPTTTLMYSFRDISVVQAQIVMRGSLIAFGIIIDRLLHKKVVKEEFIALGFTVLAVLAICLNEKGGRAIFTSADVMWVLGSYVSAYGIRVYIMQVMKNKMDNRAFFAAEQAFAALTMITVATVAVVSGTEKFGFGDFRKAVFTENWLAVLGGVPYGFVAIPSVLIYMFKGRNTTFSVLCNRLPSLAAGLFAGVVVWLVLNQTRPGNWSLIGLGLIVVASYFLVKAEAKRDRLKLAEASGR